MAEDDILEDRIKCLRSVIRRGTRHPRRDLFWFEIMGGCGCGASDELSDDAWLVFCAFRDKAYWRKRICEETSLEVLAHWMDSIGLIEHGGSIAFSWLTPLGEDVWTILQEVDE